MKKIKYILLGAAATALPLAANAQTFGGGSLRPLNNANDVITRIASMGNVAIYLLMGFAVLYIVYATVMYFIKGGEGADRKEAGMKIMWGIVGLAIIVSLWGMVNILINTFWTGYNRTPTERFPNANFIGNPQ